jgi:mannose-1-phosphate guanylyltransferase
MNVAPVKALLLAGGLGTRLRPVTDEVPKCLVPIAGRPLLDYWIDALEAAGICEAVINTHHLAQQLRRHIDLINATRRVRLSESHEPVLLGSAGTVHANRNFIGHDETCVIIYTDNLSTVDLSQMLRFHRSHSDPITMLLFRAPHPERCGIAQLDEVGRISAFIEKPRNPAGNLANGGIYMVNATAFHAMADMNAFDLAKDVLPRFSGRMRGWIWTGYHRDIGTLESLEQANADAVDLSRSGLVAV